MRNIINNVIVYTMTSFEHNAKPVIEQCDLKCDELGSCFLQAVNSSIGEIALANEHEADDILRSEEEPTEAIIIALEVRHKLIQSLHEIAVRSCALNQK